MSDADCQESEGAAQPELRHPAGHPVRLRYCQGHQAARGVVSVKEFLPSHKQVAYYYRRYTSSSALQMQKRPNI